MFKAYLVHYYLVSSTSHLYIYLYTLLSLHMFFSQRTTDRVLHSGWTHRSTWRSRPGSCRSKSGILFETCEVGRGILPAPQRLSRGGSVRWGGHLLEGQVLELNNVFVM